MKLVWRQMAVALLLSGIAVTAAGRTSPWRQYNSDHFVLYSDRGSRESTQLLQQFERFRYAALYITGLDTGQAEAPVAAFLFSQKEDYSAVQPNTQVAGFYRDGWGGPEMVVGAEAKLRDVSLIFFHEYVHFLVRIHSQARYPLWYDEGFADLMAASHVADDHVLIGLPHPWRIDTLAAGGALLPLADVLSADTVSGGVDAAFYATAWLLMHYLQLDHLAGGEVKSDSLAAYLQQLAAGADPLTTFEARFGISLEAAQAKLQTYRERRQWKGYRLALPSAKYEVSSQALHANEAAYLLGGLAYRAGQPAAALEFLQRIDAKDASVAPVFSLRAVIEGHMGRTDLAQHILGFALAKGSNNSVVLGNAAHVHWDLAKAADVAAPGQAEHLQQVEVYARKALEADSANIEATRFLAEAYRSSGRIQQAISLLLQQYRARTGDVRLNLELAALYVQAGEPAKAVAHLENVVQWDHSSQRRQEAAAMLQSIRESKPALVGELHEDYASPLRIAPRPK